jgi:tRNA (guanine-N(7)-)-methyltransferase subunit TRM82
VPKRPSAIAISGSHRDIIYADKFGDAYSLPLLPDEAAAAAAADALAAKEPKRYAPSASHLTVHSARNRRALEEQLKNAAALAAAAAATSEPSTPQSSAASTTTTTTTTTAAITTAAPAKPPFQLTLLLGHVSLLTALLAIRIPDAACASGHRDYLITADRDEHVRITRGPPQTHVIEGFCWGHAAFVSRLCVLEGGRRQEEEGGRQEVLVSGGGDPALFVWRWREGRLLGKVEVKEKVAEAVGQVLMEERGGEIAVAGMWAVPERWSGGGTEGGEESSKVSEKGAFLIWWLSLFEGSPPPDEL